MVPSSDSFLQASFVLTWCHSGLCLERCAEITLACEACHFCNVHNRKSRGFYQRFCLLDADSCDIFRLIAPCFVTGEAAGTAAALAALKGVTPRQLDVGSVQKALREKNVWLG